MYMKLLEVYYLRGETVTVPVGKLALSNSFSTKTKRL